MAEQPKSQLTTATLPRALANAGSPNSTTNGIVVPIGIVALWQGEEYDAIGQWTDTDVINKLKSL